MPFVPRATAPAFGVPGNLATPPRPHTAIPIRESAKTDDTAKKRCRVGPERLSLHEHEPDLATVVEALMGPQKDRYGRSG